MVRVRSYHARVKSGIGAKLLESQVKNTCAWLWDEPRAAEVTRIIDRASASDVKGGPEYLRLLLAAHYATVATFVPTDVDARIRHHAWTELTSGEQLTQALDIVDQAASWDPRLVSERVVDGPHGPLCGHQGEWFSVRAGALGRALVLGEEAIADRVMADIDRELTRERTIFQDALTARAPASRVLAIATVIAHNLGDLSRVVDQWPGGDKVASVKSRYVRLGHADATSPDKTFVLAGTLNKALMALENHRFLALRKARGLRNARALLLPIGPWFDAWGATLATSEHMTDRERIEVIAALLEIHLSSPEQLGCLRALAGVHRATRGGLELYVPDLPARIRKEALRGKVREALDVTLEHFDARMDRRLRSELEKAG